MIKALTSLVIVAVLTLTIAFVPVRRYRVNLERRKIENLVFRAESTASGYEKRQLSLQLIDRANDSLRTDPADYKMLVLRGAAEAAAGLPDRALATYRQALTINERPEIYAYIGVLQIESGEIDIALDNLTRAATFNVATKRLVAWPTQQLIDQRIEARRNRLASTAEVHGAR